MFHSGLSLDQALYRGKSIMTTDTANPNPYPHSIALDPKQSRQYLTKCQFSTNYSSSHHCLSLSRQAHLMRSQTYLNPWGTMIGSYSAAFGFTTIDDNTLDMLEHQRAVTSTSKPTLTSGDPLDNHESIVLGHSHDRWSSAGQVRSGRTSPVRAL